MPSAAEAALPANYFELFPFMCSHASPEETQIPFGNDNKIEQTWSDKELHLREWQQKQGKNL